MWLELQINTYPLQKLSTSNQTKMNFTFILKDQISAMITDYIAPFFQKKYFFLGLGDFFITTVLSLSN